MFVCTICGETFASVNVLGDHLIFYHQLLKSGNFLCHFCKKSIVALDKFKLHLTKKHPDGLPAQSVNHDGHGAEEVGNVDGANNEINQDNDNNVINGEFDDSHLSLEHFVNNLYNNVEVFIAQMYALPTANRKLVDEIICGASQLISTSVSVLRHNVFHFLSSFEDVPDNYADEVSKLESMFSTLEEPFECMDSEHRRFQTLSASGCYIAPVKFEMGQVDRYVKNREGTVELLREPVYGQMIPLRHVLKKFLEMPGVFRSIQNFILNLDDSKISNFMQGTLWKDLKQKFDQERKFVLPLHLQFDHYQPDNSLGSHSSSHSLGALYASLPCLPREAQACLDNMFLFTLFESKYKKMFGNEKAFSCTINEVDFLETNGVTVNCDEEATQVHFCCSLIIADNLGYNAILGFVESFNGNFYCRICKLHRDEMEHRCRPVPQHMLRTVENYAEDVEVHDVSLTGVNEQCVWNSMPSYHCITNSNCDSMHDVQHGILKYDLCQILYYLIGIRQYFSIELLIERIDGFVLGPNDEGNRPPTFNITIERLKNCSLNLSASEWLCLCLYLGQMIGDLVPEGNNVWKMYLLLREIVLVINAPSFEKGVEIYLQTLFTEHHELYLKYFGELKPKHHLGLHHSATLIQNGPLSLVSSLPCERNHRKGKLYAKVSNSRVNIAFSTAVKSQLSLCERLMRPDGFTRLVKTCGVTQTVVRSLPGYVSVAHLLNYDFFDIVSVANSVEVYGTNYCLNTVIVLKVGELLPLFGKICQIIVKDSKSVIFIVNVLESVYYHSHISAYEVKPTDEFSVVEHENLLYYVPLWERHFYDKFVVSLKHML